MKDLPQCCEKTCDTNQFWFVSHISHFHYSSESSWAVFVDNLHSDYDCSNILATKHSQGGFCELVGEHTFFPLDKWLPDFHGFVVWPVWLGPYSFDYTFSPWVSDGQSGGQVNVYVKVYGYALVLPWSVASVKHSKRIYQKNCLFQVLLTTTQYSFNKLWFPNEPK